VGWAFARVYFLIRRRRYAVNSARRRFGHPEDGSEDDNPEIAAIAAKHDTDIGSTLRRHIQPLGGLWVKVGQFLATRADAMPAALVVELRALLDDTESRPLHEVLGTMRDELGEEGIGMVAEMESEPISSASIAQVWIWLGTHTHAQAFCTC
jgi:predicted unusual protein kinase regulating ubiquinone biosynthesis (AarF/ABC1/UbiB family)